jgi:hypothetical protein
VSKYRDFSPHDQLPATFADALNEFLGGSSHNFKLLIKPSDATVLQVPAGVDNDQVAIAINGKWRYNTAAVERASPGGSARNLDVYVTTGDNSFAAGSPGEVDNTDYSFALAIVEHNAFPTGVAHYRKVATAFWTGTAFVGILYDVGPQAANDGLQPGDLVTSAASARVGCLLCDGSAVSRTTYAALYAALGGASSPWGQGDGTTTFNVPDFRGRAIVGAGAGAGLTARTRWATAAAAKLTHTRSRGCRCHPCRFPHKRSASRRTRTRSARLAPRRSRQR